MKTVASLLLLLSLTACSYPTTLKEKHMDMSVNMLFPQDKCSVYKHAADGYVNYYIRCVVK